MLSLLDLISQNQPHFQTHQALLVIGLQNDFLQPDGRLPVDTRSGFLERTQALIPRFRQLSTNVIWVKTLYEADRMANDPNTGEGDAVVVGGLVDGVESSTDDDDDLPKEPITPPQSRSSRNKQRALDLLKKVSARRQKAPPEASILTAEEDEELFLLRSSRKAPACLPNTAGAEFADAIKPSIAQADTVLQTTNYSAFLGTSLLLILRAKLVTELYICGCITNISVLATVIDAARHGITINVVVDCLGYRKQNRHDEALKRMVEFLDANMVTSQEVLDQNTRNPSEDSKRHSKYTNGSSSVDEMLGNRVAELQLNDGGPTSSISSRPPSYQSPLLAVNGRPRTLSDASYAESRMTTDTKLSDDQFAEMLTRGAKVQNDNPPPVVKQNLVKSKIRMRSRTSKPKKVETKDDKNGEDKKIKTESSKKGETPKKSESARQAEAVVRQTENATPPPTKSSGETADKATRSSVIVKAESSDKLSKSSSKREQQLKSSISQPSLSVSSAECKEAKPPPSRMRLALSRASKSDTKVPTTQPLKSPTKMSTVEVPQKSPSKAAPEPPLSPTKPAAQASATTNTSSAPVAPTPMKKKLQSLATFPVLRPGDRIAEGDSRIIYDFIPPELRHPTDRSKPLKDLIFQQLYNEVRWQKMLHQQGEVPRLVCCQGEFGADGSMPVYRHPSDQVLPLLHFSPKVQVIRKQAEKIVGHPLNHVLIQLYRSGNDYISEHSDKTLDIVRGSSIVNVSFGAQRTMRLRTKKSTKQEGSEEDESRTTQRVAMPHNSMFVLGLETNKKWLHGINQDKRLDAERSEEEKSYSGIRISLTFRQIGTFLDAENSTIWGQGATSKEQRDASDVINDSPSSNEKLVRVFSQENHDPDFDWEAQYGSGFDILHFRNAPEDVPILFASHNPVETQMVKILLAELKINYTLLEAPTTDKQYELDRQVSYRDNDVNHTETSICVPILLYLDHYHPLDRDDRGRASTSRSLETFISMAALLKAWYNRNVPTYHNEFIDRLEALEEQQGMGPGPFIAGRRFATGDCAMWPALDELVSNWEGWTEERFPCLTEYYRMLWKKKKSVAVLRGELPVIRKKSEEQKEGDDAAGCASGVA